MKHSSDAAFALAGIFRQNGHRLFIVGGSVRNLKLGLIATDTDICSAALPEQVCAFLKKAGCSIVEKALSLGTVEVHFIHGGEKHIFEHTTFRQDFYRQGGQHRPYKVEFTDDIEKDARRRDFTVNALYLDIQSGEILDPTGYGLKDIENKVLRAAAKEATDTISDDGLRIMRMVRLSAELGFGIDSELFECAKQNAGLLYDISAERKRQELEKILLADTKYSIEKAHEKGLMLLSETGVLKAVLPELEEGRGIQQHKQYHAYDVLEHCIHVCGAAPPKLTLRLAALLHDIGKPQALRQGGNMYGHEKYGAETAQKLLSSLKFDNDTKKTAITLVENHMFDLEGRAKPKTIRKRAVVLGKDIFEMLIDLRIADEKGSGLSCSNSKSAENWKHELDIMLSAGVPWSVLDLNITGRNLIEELNIKPSEQLGSVLKELFEYCVLYPGANQKEHLIRRAKTLLRQLDKNK